MAAPAVSTWAPANVVMHCTGNCKKLREVDQVGFCLWCEAPLTEAARKAQAVREAVDELERSRAVAADE